MDKKEYTSGTKKIDVLTPMRGPKGEPKVAEVTAALDQMASYVKAGTFKYDNIVIDSLTMGMSDGLASFIGANYNMQSPAAKNPLLQYSGGQEAWPIYRALAESTRQLCAVSMSLSALGLIVVCFAAQTDQPKYNRAIQAGPLFLGQDFPGVAPGYFDLIGKVADDGDFPRGVKFYSHDDSFIAKWCDSSPREEAEGPLDFGKLFDVVGDDFGASILIYGPYGSGKTYSVSTLPGYTLLINLERDPGRVLKSFIT